MFMSYQTVKDQYITGEITAREFCDAVLELSQAMAISMEEMGEALALIRNEVSNGHEGKPTWLA
jgi:hypothetical protein